MSLLNIKYIPSNGITNVTYILSVRHMSSNDIHSVRNIGFYGSEEYEFSNNFKILKS